MSTLDWIILVVKLVGGALAEILAALTTHKAAVASRRKE